MLLVFVGCLPIGALENENTWTSALKRQFLMVCVSWSAEKKPDVGFGQNARVKSTCFEVLFYGELHGPSNVPVSSDEPAIASTAHENPLVHRGHVRWEYHRSLVELFAMLEFQKIYMANLRGPAIFFQLSVYT